MGDLIKAQAAFKDTVVDSFFADLYEAQERRLHAVCADLQGSMGHPAHDHEREDRESLCESL